jgi:hypothetical protein
LAVARQPIFECPELITNSLEVANSAWKDRILITSGTRFTTGAILH